MRLLLVLLLTLLPALGQAEEVVLGLSRNNVAITANFDGSELLIFGAVKREEPIRQDLPLEVIITVTGPSTAVTVRRKERTFGIWVNRDSVDVDVAPSFYAVATTGPMTDVLKDIEDLRYKISINRAIRSVGAPSNILDAERFTDALIRIRQNRGLYLEDEGGVELDEQTLFRTSLRLPANLTEGRYKTRIFLTRGGDVISNYETEIEVRKVGLERWLYSLSRNQPMLYGLMSLAIAVAAGWGASEAFRLLRNS